MKGWSAEGGVGVAVRSPTATYCRLRARREEGTGGLGRQGRRRLPTGTSSHGQPVGPRPDHPGKPNLPYYHSPFSYCQGRGIYETGTANQPTESMGCVFTPYDMYTCHSKPTQVVMSPDILTYIQVHNHSQSAVIFKLHIKF